VSALLLANENWPHPALSALHAAGLDIQAVAVDGRSVRRRALPLTA